jgi:predicted DsbA family dithiol-disulfide isomerase
MRIEVYADLACPWCYIGLRRLNRALAARPAVTAEKIWRPFQLQPDLAREGVPYLAHLTAKFGSRIHEAWGHVAEQGTPEGIDFQFAKIPTAANTAGLHRLVLWAGDQGRAWDMAEALFHAHFTAGVDIAQPHAVLGAVAAAGFDQAGAAALLAGDQHADQVVAAQDTAARLGIRGVPFYVVDGQYGLSGAQPYEVFLQMLDQLGGTP